MRRRLRLALREAREAAGLTQRAVAEKLDWSLSKIIRIEQGAVGITPVDVRALLTDVYGVIDDKQVDELVDLARRSRKQPWAEYRSVYGQDALNLFGSEAAARVIYKYEPTFVPGLLQTPEYAHALLTSLGNPERDVELMVSARMERQELLDREDRPELQFIIGEAAVSRAVGGPRAMARQLERIKELGTRPGISLQILPFAAGEHPSMGAAFTILEFADVTVSDVLYLETHEGITILHEDAEKRSEYLEYFDTLQRLATKPDELASVLDTIEAQRFKGAADAPTAKGQDSPKPKN